MSCSELETTYHKCHALFEPSPKSRMKRARVAFSAWMNANKVEEEIAVLKDHVNTCHIQFTVCPRILKKNSGANASQTFAAARIEGSTREIHSSTARIEVTTARIERLLVFDSDQVAELKHMEGRISNLDTSNLASEVTKSTVSDAYLRYQVEEIDKSLMQLSTKDHTYPVNAPLDDYLQPFQPVITMRTPHGDREARHRDVVKKTLEILQTLQQGSSNLSIQEGAWDMVNLAISLYELDMFQEAVTIGSWTANLFRTLYEVEPDIYKPYLALSLLNLARYYLETSSEKAFDPMEESLALSRSLQETSSTPEIRSQLGRSLTTYASMLAKKKKHEQALATAQEAVEIFEAILREVSDWVDALASSTPPKANPFNDWTPSSPSIASSEATMVADNLQKPLNQEISGDERLRYDHGRAMIQVSFNLEDAARLDEAQKINFKVLEIFRNLSESYPESIFDDYLASTLYRIGHRTFRDITPEDEAIKYIDQSAALYHKLYKLDADKYSSSLYDVLWQQATILGALERFDEAYNVWQEAADVAKRLMSDQLYLADALIQACWNLRQLKRHDDAVILRMESVQTYHTVMKKANKFEADACRDLAIDYQLAGRDQEGIPWAEDAVTQYRALAFESPEEFAEKLANGLSTLGQLLSGAGEQDKALSKLLEAMGLYDTIVTKDSSFVPRYIRVLRILTAVVFNLNDVDNAIASSHDVLRRLRELRANHPEAVGWYLSEAMENHGLLLVKSNRLEEAVRWAQEVIQWYENLPADNPEAVEKYLVCLINNASDLDHLGRSEQALVPIRKAIDLGKQFYSASSSVASYTASSMLRYASILWELGRYADALAASTESVGFGRSIPIDDITEFGGCLVVHSICLNSNDRSLEAVACAQEAVDICRNAPTKKISETNIFCFLQLPHALQALSDSLADAGDERRALQAAQESLDECLKLKDHQKVLPWTFSESPYGDALLCLANQLLASGGDIERCLDILGEAKKLQTRRSESRTGTLTELASILRTLGLCYCFLGRHEEGLATRTELNSLQNRLRIAFPDIHRRMITAFERDDRRPSWRRLLQRLNLQCTHQC